MRLFIISFCVIASMIQSMESACPTIITRAQWGARAAKPGVGKLPNSVTYAVIHHGASAACADKASCTNMVKSFQNLHMDTNGWSDIGYNFVVGEDGNVYEGRGWTGVGAHSPAYNSDSIGICIIGNFMTKLPNAKTLQVVKDLIGCGISKGHIKSAYKLQGHRDGTATACPGDTLYTLIKTWTNYGG